MFLHHDNAIIHTAQTAFAEVTNCGFKLLLHLPYSPDEGPSDFFRNSIAQSAEAVEYADCFSAEG